MELAEVKFSEVSAYVFLDKGSSGSYVTEALARKLKLPLQGLENLCVGKFERSSRKKVEYQTSIIEIPTAEGELLSNALML